MEKLKIKGDKVVIQVPANLGKELRDKVTSVINGWESYYKPKFEERGSNFCLDISKSLVDRIQKFIKGHTCSCCGEKLKEHDSSVAVQIGYGKRELSFHPVCNKCFTFLNDGITLLKEHEGNVVLTIKKGERKLEKKLFCPECGAKATVGKFGNYEWASKDGTAVSFRKSVYHPDTFKEGDKVEVSGKEGKIIRELFIRHLVTIRTKDDNSIEDYDEQDVKFISGKISKRKLRRIKRLKRRK